MGRGDIAILWCVDLLQVKWLLLQGAEMLV